MCICGWGEFEHRGRLSTNSWSASCMMLRMLALVTGSWARRMSGSRRVAFLMNGSAALSPGTSNNRTMVGIVPAAVFTYNKRWGIGPGTKRCWSVRYESHRSLKLWKRLSFWLKHTDRRLWVYILSVRATANIDQADAAWGLKTVGFDCIKVNSLCSNAFLWKHDFGKRFTKFMPNCSLKIIIRLVGSLMIFRK